MQFQSPLSRPPAKPIRDQRKPLSAYVPQLILESWTNLALGLHTWCAIAHSFREHMRIEFSTSSLDLGPAFAPLAESHWGANARTTARAEGIKKLQATRPKADIADIEIFLAGFDSGEQYASDRENSLPRNNLVERHSQQQPLESSDAAIS